MTLRIALGLSLTLTCKLLSMLLLINSRLVNSFELDILGVEEDAFSLVCQRFLGAETDVGALLWRQLLFLVAFRDLHLGAIRFTRHRILRLVVVKRTIPTTINVRIDSE